MSESVTNCVVNGEPMEPKSGMDTPIGPVCDHCLPAYAKAETVAHMEASTTPGASEIELIQGKLRDAGFVKEAIAEASREEVLYIVDRAFADGYVPGHADTTRLKRAFLRAVNLKNYYHEDDTQGVGLEIEQALACMNEEDRTFAFLKAVLQDVDRLEASRDVVELVDAGCGPVPLFGLVAAIKSDKVRVTCLEVNPASAKMARDVIEYFGLSDRVKVVIGDASEYQHGKKIDVIVSETMYAGLANEPLVRVLDHLTDQVADDGLVIPRWVDVEAGLIPVSEESEVAIDLQKVLRYEPGVEKLSQISFILPLNGLGAGEYRLVLSSEVGVGDGVTLSGHSSTITKPKRVAGVITLDGDGSGKNLLVSYVPGQPEETIELQVV